jgi:hypothetical protein
MYTVPRVTRRQKSVSSAGFGFQCPAPRSLKRVYDFGLTLTGAENSDFAHRDTVPARGRHGCR